MWNFVRWGALLITTSVFAECQPMARVHWRVDLHKKSIQWEEVSGRKESLCLPLAQDPMANIELVFTGPGLLFKRRIYSALTIQGETQDASGKLVPVRAPAQVLYLSSPIPDWAQRAPLSIHDVASGRVLAKGRP